MIFSHPVFRKTLVYAIAVGCLAWVMHGVRVDELVSHMRSLQLWWILPALVLDVLSTLFHGLRWQLLLRPSGHVTWRQTAKAVYAGLFVNEILPMRAGEFVRGYLVTRWMGVSFAPVLSSMITERVFDGSLLLLGLCVFAFFESLPERVANAGFILGAAWVIAIGVLVLLTVFKRRPSGAGSAKAGRLWVVAKRITSFLSRVIDGLRAVWSSPYLVPALVVSFVVLSLQAMSFWLVMKAYGLLVPLWVPAVVLIMIRLGTAVPNAPANIGPYQFFCVLGLTFFGIDKTTATGFAIVLFLVMTIPLVTLGFIAFVRSGVTLGEIREARKSHHNRR
ncbi:MAG: flippase-like domain-containing protein [Candidatus Latescibacterota bacterium]|nr:MAG: flippase-like domain-containing protein [Candidatus Latescibacterota bacterium]